MTRWAVLSDIRAVGCCMPGAQITEQLDETHYKGTVKTKVGPASMQFGGEIEVLGVDALIGIAAKDRTISYNQKCKIIDHIIKTEADLGV